MVIMMPAIEVDPKITVAEELKYQQGYEELYDLPDPRYEEWLRLKQPADQCLFCPVKSDNFSFSF